MDALTRLLEAALAALLREDETGTVRLTATERVVVAELRVPNSHMAGVVIGRDGETVNALRHLADRVGRAQRPPMRVVIEVVVEEAGS